MAGSANGTSSTTKKSKRARKITFIYIQNGDVKLFNHATSACSVAEAWNETAGRIPVSGEGSSPKLVGAVPGHVDFMKDHIRKPTYKEMEKMLATQAVPA